MKTDDELIQEAIDFARPYHEAKDPGYFHDHVMAVFREVARNDTNVNVWIAALFHDLLEDTDCPKELVLEKFGYPVYWMVECLTDEPGKNRKERKWKTYHKIRRSRITVLIKLCDRIDNMRRCLRDPSAKYSMMYLGEDHTFRSALWEPLDWQDVWETYTDLVELLHRQVARHTTNG